MLGCTRLTFLTSEISYRNVKLEVRIQSDYISCSGGCKCTGVFHRICPNFPSYKGNIKKVLLLRKGLKHCQKHPKLSSLKTFSEIADHKRKDHGVTKTIMTHSLGL